jgi:hypothetical protein
MAQPERRDWFRIVNKADDNGDTAYIEIFDVIGYDPWWTTRRTSSLSLTALRSEPGRCPGPTSQPARFCPIASERFRIYARRRGSPAAPDQLQRLLGDLQLLVGRHDEHRHGAVLGGDHAHLP